ncbi:AmmeMemoRadiSam system protein B [Candidatus Peregrinibacteria bacterium]|nr:AmmeMemoRadiSam system protein B [Candidatus Peregrinibacteria bacterium]
MDLKVRKAEYAGLYYPSDPAELDRTLDLALAEAATLGPDYSELNIPAMIVPCGGYIYTAKTASAAFQKVINRKYERVIVIGVTHFISVSGLAMTEMDAYETPYGNIELDKEFIDELKNDFDFSVNEMAFAKEYSIELQLPFLKKYLGDFKLVPILVGNKMNYQEVAENIAGEIDEKTLIVISTNFSHFLSDEKARSFDQNSINLLLEGNTKKILAEVQASAIGGLALLNEIALVKHWQPAFLNYQNSSEAGDDKDSVVGFASFVYFSQ